METNIYTVISTLIYLIPLCTVIWKASALASEIKVAKEKIAELEKETKLERASNEASIQMILNSINEIKNSLTELKTKFEERTGK